MTPGPKEAASGNGATALPSRIGRRGRAVPEQQCHATPRA